MAARANYFNVRKDVSSGWVMETSIVVDDPEELDDVAEAVATLLGMRDIVDKQAALKAEKAERNAARAKLQSAGLTEKELELLGITR